MHRGRMARRDMDFRGGAEKRDALEDVSTEMLQMKVRMKQMAVSYTHLTLPTICSV